MWSKIFKSKSSKSSSKKDSGGEYHSTPSKSKLSKVVNSFTLKRCSKENSSVEGVRADSSNNELTDGAEPPTCASTAPSSLQSDYSTASESIGEPVNLDLKPCPICTRTFLPAPLAKHVKICEKMAMKKRKIFDSSRQRREGTDLADFLPKNFGLPPSKQEPKVSPKAVQSAPVISPRKQEEPLPLKQTPVVQKKTLPSPVTQPTTGSLSAPPKEKEKPKPVLKRSLVPTPEQCPFCERSFGTKAYERHVEWCKEKTRIANIQKSHQQSVAKERLQARNKYRPPCLKTKRAANREKYSGLNCGESTNSLSDGGNNNPTTKPSPEEQKMSMSTSLSSSIMSDGLVSKTSSNPNGKIFKTPEETSEDVSAQSPSSCIKKPIRRSMQLQRKSLSDLKTSASPTNSKSSKILKTKKSLEDGMHLSEERPATKQTKLHPESLEGISNQNDVSVNQENFELTVTACNAAVNEKYLDTSESASNRTGRTYLTDNEDQYSNKEVIVNDDPMAESSDTQGVTFEPEATVKYTNYDDIPVGSSKVRQMYEELNIPVQEEKEENSKNNTKQEPEDHNQNLEKEDSSSSLNNQNLEMEGSSKPLNEVDSKSVIRRFSSYAQSEELDPDIAEFYSYAPECAKSFEEEENRIKEEMNKLTAEQTEFFDSTMNDFTLSLQEEYEEELEEPHSLKSFIVSGLSDKYDPFLSAKRQLEELCSPTSPTTPAISPTMPTTKQRTTSLSSSLSSSSNPRSTLNSVKSNFRRTSSLRAPRKASARPLFITPTMQKPTIQRGLSDEGPISTNFLKPEEYDEMPVKSVCINDFAIAHSPKVIKRDTNTNANRRNLRLNLNKINDKSNGTMPLSKTDSLAVFLKYENEAKQVQSPIDLTEKDLKDKTNILSKQTSQKSLSSNMTPLTTDKENIPSLKDSLANIIESKNNFLENSKNIDLTAKPLISSKIYPIRLEPLPKPASPKLPSNYSLNETSNNINLSSILDFKDNDYIDPKLINVCDNLPVNVSKLSDSDLTSSSTDSASTTKIITETPNQLQRQNQYQQLHQTSSNRNSTERKNLLKRQMRLGKNQFLYDMSPDSDPYSEECDKTISMIESSTKLLDSSLNEPSFDDFDFEEFLSSFEHDENQFPIFKDCKEFLLNRSFNKRCNNLSDYSARSPTTTNVDYENDDGKREIFISIETSQNGSSPSPTDPPTHSTDPEVDKNANKVQKTEDEQTSGHDEKQDMFDDIIDINRNNARNIMKKMEREFIQNDSSLTHETTATGYPMDSDEISSVECYPVRRSTKSKQSADSAYGSLSRHSPTDQRSLRKNQLRNRQQSASSIPEQPPPKSKYLQKGDSKQRNRDLSASSSGSDTSLPPIQPQMEKEKHYYGDEVQQSKKEIRMSKFCHECGNKFLIVQAKFCMECGVKRVVLE